jgi:GNAT superfamily N-acetyltransferase
MLTELASGQHENLRPLFANFGSRLHGCVEAVFSGNFGRAWANDPIAPTVALAHLDFWFVAGDLRLADASETVRMVPERGTIVTAGGPWDVLVRETLGANIRTFTRTAMATPSPEAWDRHALRAFVASLPDRYSIRRPSVVDIDQFLSLEKDLIANFVSPQRFLDRGIGFGVWFDNRCVSGCSSYTLANRKLEIEIDTHPDFRRRGLARAVASAMILHCLDQGIEPCWDAQNPESVGLALQLGFVSPQPYAVFRRQ